MKPELVGWCPDCRAYVKPYSPHERCPSDGFDRHPSQYLHRRRVYICPHEVCDGWAYWKASDLREHLELEHSAEVEG